MKSMRAAYYLVARSYTESSAGVRAMHILCHLLNQLGQEAFLVPLDSIFLTNSNLQTPIITKEKRDWHLRNEYNIVVIQDESIIGNPLRGHVVVCWLLNYSGILAGKGNSAADFEFVYAREIDENKHRLFVNTIDYKFFEAAQRKDERKLRLFYGGKLRSQGMNFELPADVIEIHREGPLKQSREVLRNLLTQAQVLYLAEDSALALEAAICGCPTVHMQEFFTRPPLSSEDGSIGIAKSESVEDLAEAMTGKAELERYMAKLDLRSFSDVSKFVIRTSQSDKGSGFLKPRHRVSFYGKIRMRLGKLIAAYKKSKFKGIYGVFSSHRNQKKSG